MQNIFDNTPKFSEHTRLPKLQGKQNVDAYRTAKNFSANQYASLENSFINVSIKEGPEEYWRKDLDSSISKRSVFRTKRHTFDPNSHKFGGHTLNSGFGLDALDISQILLQKEKFRNTSLNYNS